MKKVLLTVFAALAATSAFASIEGTYKATQFTIYDVDDNYKFVVEDAYDQTDPEAEAWNVVIEAGDAENTYKITNLGGWDEVMIATFNPENSTFVIAGGSSFYFEEDEYELFFCGGTKSSSDVTTIISTLNPYYGYIYAQDTPLKDIVLKLDGNKIVAETPILYYYGDDNYDYIIGAGAEIIDNLVISKPGTTGINAVELDANAPAEFFNLQGVRVSNPAAGETLIRRQGSKVSKVIVK